MSNEIPLCPIGSVEKDIIRKYTDDRRELSLEQEKLRLRMLGQGSIRLSDLKRSIKLKKRHLDQQVAINGGVLSSENIRRYEAWLEELYQHVENR